MKFKIVFFFIKSSNLNYKMGEYNIINEIDVNAGKLNLYIKQQF